MKNYLILFSLLFVGLMGASEVYACGGSASITGPNGRCAVPANTPTVYTGTHTFSSSGCTYYEWEIEGGTITGPSGVSVTDGKLCITENVACFPDLDLSCDVADIDVAVASGNGASVTVTWQPGVVGKLKLKAKEKGTITLSADTEITNDISLPTPTSISFSATGNTSGTFTANLPLALCPGQTVRWTVNGSFAGTGNPRNLSVGLCSTATVCATVTQNVGGTTLSSGQACRSFTGGTLIASVVGQLNAPLNGFNDYFLNSNQPISTISWSVSPPSAANFIGPTNEQGVLLTFTQEGFVSVCATGTTECGNSFSRCITVNVDRNGPLNVRPDEEIVAETDRENIEVSEEIITPDFKLPEAESNQSDEQAFAVFPTLASQGQEITVQLPELNDAAFIIISDMQGRRISQIQVTDSAASINTSDLPTGVFILTAYSGQWMESTKFVIN